MEYELRKSPMGYCLKANFYLRGERLSCLSKLSLTEGFIAETGECCKRSPFAMMPWIFNEYRWRKWVKERPPELKKMDLEKAIREGRISLETIIEEGIEAKVIQIEETLVIIVATEEVTEIGVETIN